MESEPPPELFAQINEAAESDHPLPLLQLSSALLGTMDPRSSNPFERHKSEAPDQADFMETLMETDLPETSLLLAASRTLITDELLAARIRRLSLAGYPTSIQQEYAAPTAYRAVEMSHVLGDGDNIFIGARNAVGDEFTFLVYIDHNLGTLVKDAFTSDGPIESIMAHMHSTMPAAADDYTLTELNLAEARAKIEDAIELSSITYPPLETETWPGERALLEAVVRQAPAGGSGYQRPEYTDEQLGELTEDFFDSLYGRELAGPGSRFLLESVLWFGTDYGPGDPLRWSPPAVEILLVDWFPRKIVAPAEDLRPLPKLLRAFVQYSHDRRNIREGLTVETLESIDRFAPEFEGLINSERRQGPESLLEAIGALPPLEQGDSTFDDAQGDIQRRMDKLAELEAAGIEEIMLDGIRRSVGGAEQMEHLDEIPLPAEDFAWDQIPGDIHERVRQVLDLCDRCCADLLDADTSDASGAPSAHEHRTAARRLLARVSAGDPAIFRRKGAANTAAGAICWIIAKANDRLNGNTGGFAAKDLLAHFGVKGSVSQRAEVMLRAAGIDDQQFGAMRLGTPALLTSDMRRHLIEMRDKYQAQTPS